MSRLTDARLIAVGDELLNGRTLDANSHEIQQRLVRRGVDVGGVAVVPDRAAAIAAALTAAPAGCLVVLTGGLGPTPDDLTAMAVADWAGVALTQDDTVAAALRARCEARGRTYGPNLVKQSQLPQGLTALPNPEGTAPAMVGDLHGRTLVLLPGVPSEMRALWPLVEAWLQDGARLGPARPVLLRRTTRLSEPALARLTAPLLPQYPDCAWSWWLTRWGVDVQAVAPASETALPAGLADQLDAALGDRVWAREFVDLPAVVLTALRDAGATVAAAESCTGGLLGAAFTDVPSASDAYRGGIVAYADAVKRDLLDVPADLLRDHGAVSGECARAMAAGCRARCRADVALSVTGVAGPGGGSAAKPVGTIWFGLAAATGTFAGRARFPAHRGRNRELAVAVALDALRRHLADGGDPFAPADWDGWS